jgi:hypothetical protein
VKLLSIPEYITNCSNNITAYTFKGTGVSIVKNKVAEERRWNSDQREALRPRSGAFLVEDPDRCVHGNILGGKSG